MSKLTAAADDDLAARITAYLENYPLEITWADVPEEVYDRYHAPGYAIVSDGTTLDRERLLAHVRPARRRVASVSVHVDDLVCAGSRFAARYTLEATMRKGAVIATEIHVLGEVADDGRVRGARQLTRDVSAARQGSTHSGAEPGTD